MMSPTSLRRKLPPPPKGFFPTAVWAKKWKLSVAQTKRVLDRARSDKIVRCIRLERRDACGVRPCNYYGPA